MDSLYFDHVDTRTGRRGGKKKNSFYGNNPAHGGEDGVGEDEGEEDGEGEEDRFQSFTELWQSWKTIAQLYGEGAIGPAAHKVLGRAVLRRTFYQLFNRFIRRRGSRCNTHVPRQFHHLNNGTCDIRIPPL